MNISSQIADKVSTVIERMKASGDLPAELDLKGIEIQESRGVNRGEFFSNAAMILAKRINTTPRDLAHNIANKLTLDKFIAQVDVAGPGFINITVADSVWCDLIATILKDSKNYGRSRMGEGKRLHVEYVSANPTGPMHVGHCRGAVFGDTLCNLLSFVGYAVSREYYVNDAGAQIGKLGDTVFIRYLEALGDNIGEIPEGLYPGDYTKSIGQALVGLYGDRLRHVDKADALSIVRQFAVKFLLEEIHNDLACLNVHHDVFFSERSLTENGRDQVAEVIEKLHQLDLIYQGELPRPLGHDYEVWEEREQTLFRSSHFGDDIDRALMKSNGEYTYFAYDAAYHLNKLERNFDQYISVLGADHIGYISRIKSVMSALSEANVMFNVLITQLVRVMRNGELVRMSKRSGTFVALRDMVDEVGCDPIRFMMLMRKHDTTLDFDLKKIVERSKDNPVFYVQYAHARASSILRRAKVVFPLISTCCCDLYDANLLLLNNSGERVLTRELAKFPRVVESAARYHEPHRIAFYLYELASAFHQQHARGNDLPELRFIQPDNPTLTVARLALVAATQLVIACGLKILGVSAPVEMQ
ncbi:MAG: arginine--tRNA ligase [Hyphomicrobiaceae bacterium]|nr:arginine--tRNA ligase [Hyphomicrobiaceae bacterium]